jgi:hypothetical protein
MSLLDKLVGKIGNPKKKKVPKAARKARAFFTAEIAKRDGKAAARAYAKERRKKSGW